MADTSTLIERLNTVLSWELAGVIQYMHYSVLVSGPLRPVYEDYFKDGSKEARSHAELVASKIVNLGGVPTVEPQLIRPAGDLDTMLKNTLALEEAALAGWEAAWEVGDAANLGTKLWIEEMISEEQNHVDELHRILAAGPVALAVKAAGQQAG
jgi:bacterioferritin